MSGPATSAASRPAAAAERAWRGSAPAPAYLLRPQADLAEPEDRFIVVMLQGDVAGFRPRPALRLPRHGARGHGGDAVGIGDQHAVQPYPRAQPVKLDIHGV